MLIFFQKLPVHASKRVGSLLLTTLLFIATNTPAYSEEKVLPFDHLNPAHWPGEWSGSVGLESRTYRKTGELGQDTQAFSAVVAAEYFHSWDRGRSNIQFKPFVRLDHEDNERSHWDIRELSWSHRGSTWNIRAGIGQVHWGVTEFRPIVDVINQIDGVEDTYFAKQGQPLVNFTQRTDVGTFDVYALFSTRQRTYPGEDGRFRLPITIDTTQARESINDSEPFDYAIRWKQTFDALTIALSHFHGTSRDPRLIFNFDFDRPRLIPIYEEVDQSSIELEYLWNETTFKLEALTRSGDAVNYEQAKGGIEYTWAGAFNGDWDVTGILEYMWDSRKGEAPSFLDHDFLLGFRLFSNDINNTQLKMGFLIDDQTREKAVNLEFSRSINDNWDVRVLASAFIETDPVPDSFLPSSSVIDLLNDISSGEITDANDARNTLLELLDFNIYVDTDSEELQRFIGEVIINNDPTTLNPIGIASTLDSLYRMGDPNRKMNLFKEDDYIQFEIIRHF